MAYDTELADRIRRHVAGWPGVAERAMFGGLAFLLEGHMAFGIIGHDLVVRVGPDAHDAALAASPYVRPMDFTGRPMRGYVYVAPEGCEADRALGGWLDRGARFVATLPAKKKAKARRKAPSKKRARRRP